MINLIHSFLCTYVHISIDCTQEWYYLVIGVVQSHLEQILRSSFPYWLYQFTCQLAVYGKAGCCTFLRMLGTVWFLGKNQAVWWVIVSNCAICVFLMSKLSMLIAFEMIFCEVLFGISLKLGQLFLGNLKLFFKKCFMYDFFVGYGHQKYFLLFCSFNFHFFKNTTV